MGSSFGSYGIATSGMYVSERGLFVTGQNISNANTIGYTRQQSIAQSSFYHGISSDMQIGTGASIEQTRQIRHTFLDNIYRNASQLQGYSEARSNTYLEVQNILGEPMNDGMQSIMNNFWDSWQELSKDTSSLTVRALVRQRGQALVDYVNNMGTELDRLQSDINSEIISDIDEINNITAQIAALNIEIPKIESCGDHANDLRDQRNVLLDRLTNLIDADITENQNGSVDITIGGYFLVNRKESTKIITKNTTDSGMFCTPMLDGTNFELPLSGGTIKGLLESRGEVYGAVGSIENGTPSANMDITFAVDVSAGNDLSVVKDNIDTYLAQMKEKNLNCNYRLVTYSNNVINNGSVTYTNTDDFKAAVNTLSNDTSADGNFENVVSTLSGLTNYVKGADRYTVVFTGESINGNTGTATSTTDINSYIESLKNTKIASLDDEPLNMKVSVVTKSEYFNEGQAGLGEEGWATIVDQTGGRLYSTDTEDNKSMMDSLSCDTINESISSHMKDSLNIIPDIRQRLNALVNVIAREVNSLQRSGKTIHTTPVDGTDFFVAKDSSRPIEIGNISLNSNLSDLNNIISAKNGAKGDNTLALEIANLRYKACIGDYTDRLSLDGFYQDIIQTVGNKGEEASSLTKSQTSLVQAAENQRTEISGVSMDEELTRMLKYQFAYGGASKAFNAIDEMVNTVINKMGLVGR